MVAEASKDWKKTAGRAGVVIVSLAAVAAALLILFSSWCALTNLKYADTADYTRYSNMMWNTAHGAPFACNAGTDSYLRFHLSFTVALLGYLFRVWDHALLLFVLNGVLMVAGVIALAVAARRARVPPLFIATVCLYCTGYQYAQQIQLSGFHGVSLYLLLYPLLYHALLGKKYVVPVLLLILGIREEAGLMLLPLLLYFAIHHRQRAAWFYAGFALLYVLVAMLVAYPIINGQSLAESRRVEAGLLMRGGAFQWKSRLIAIAWFVLPALPLLRRGWKPILIFPSVAVITNLGSAIPYQYTFNTHNSAAAFVLLAIALCEAMRPRETEGNGRSPMLMRIASAWIIAATLTSYHQAELLPGAKHQPHNRDRYYRILGTTGQRVLRIAREHIPREGVLLTEARLGKYVSNRADLLISDIRSTPELWEDIIFCRKKAPSLRLIERIASGSWGVLYFDDDFLVLRRGADTAKNAAFLQTLPPPPANAKP